MFGGVILGGLKLVDSECVLSHIQLPLVTLFSKGIKHFVWYVKKGWWYPYAEMIEYLSFHLAVEKKKETITESAGRQQKKKIGKIGRGVRCPKNGGKLRKQLWKQSSFPSFQNYLFEVVLNPILGLMIGI